MKYIRLYETFDQSVDIQIAVNLDDEFKTEFEIDKDKYFFHARDENKMFPESIRYGWHLTFGIVGPDKYKLTEKGIPFKVLNGVKKSFEMFIKKYNPTKISFIAEGEKKAMLYVKALVSENDVINKKDSGLESFSGQPPILFMIDKYEEPQFKYEVGDYVILDKTLGWMIYPCVKILDFNSNQNRINEEPNIDYYIKSFQIDNESRIEKLWIDEEEIERLATPEEIKELKLRKEVKKYNL